MPPTPNLMDPGFESANPLEGWTTAGNTESDEYHQKEQLLEIAKRLKMNPIKLLVDFHKSDSWADPGNGWENQALFDYKNRALPR